MGGGGGGSSTTSAGVPEWARPYIEKAAGEASSLYDQGALSHVEGFNPYQDAANQGLANAAAAANQQYNVGLQGQQTFADQAAGRGVFSQAQTQGLKDRAIRDAQGALGQVDSLAGGSGVGGARSALLKGGIENDLAGQFAQFDYDALRNQQQLQSQGAQNLLGSTGQLTGQAGAGANYLGAAGDKIQQQQQNEADAAYQGVQRLFGLINPNTVGQTSTTTQSGGK